MFHPPSKPPTTSSYLLICGRPSAPILLPSYGARYPQHLFEISLASLTNTSHPHHRQVNKLTASVRSNNCLSCGLKSRPGNCPYTSVAQGSGVLVTGCRKFPIGKAAGRNASEPRCSLVIRDEDADPVDVWGRPVLRDLENGSSPWGLPG
jgi:hypothetical protein